MRKQYLEKIKEKAEEVLKDNPLMRDYKRLRYFIEGHFVMSFRPKLDNKDEMMASVSFNINGKEFQMWFEDNYDKIDAQNWFASMFEAQEELGKRTRDARAKEQDRKDKEEILKYFNI